MIITDQYKYYYYMKSQIGTEHLRDDRVSGVELDESDAHQTTI